MEAFVALVAEEQLVGAFAGAALLAAHVAVVDALHHGVPSLRHYLRHRLELLRLRRRPARRLRAAERPAEADEPLSRGGGGRGWSHGRGTQLGVSEMAEGRIGNALQSSSFWENRNGVKMRVSCLCFFPSLSLSLAGRTWMLRGGR